MQPDARACFLAHQVHRIGVVQRQSAHTKQIGQTFTGQIAQYEVNPQRRFAIALFVLAHPVNAHRDVGFFDQVQLQTPIGPTAVLKPVKPRLRGVDRRHIGLLRAQVGQGGRDFALQALGTVALKSAFGLQEQLVQALSQRRGIELFVIGPGHRLGRADVEQVGVQQLAQLEGGEPLHQHTGCGQGLGPLAFAQVGINLPHQVLGICGVGKLRICGLRGEVQTPLHRRRGGPAHAEADLVPGNLEASVLTVGPPPQAGHHHHQHAHDAQPLQSPGLGFGHGGCVGAGLRAARESVGRQVATWFQFTDSRTISQRLP